MTKYWLLIMILLLGGCSTGRQARLDAVVDTIEVTAAKVNDEHLQLSHKSLCAASASSILRLYSDNPNIAAAILVSCGWSDLLAEISQYFTNEVKL